MATVRKIYDLLDQKAPFETQMSFDNAGFLVGRGDAEVRRILISLDITEAVIREAAEMGAQLIVSHHPVIYEPAKSVVDTDFTGRRLLLLIESGIAAICAHTNLDLASGGVNDVLSAKLGVCDPVPFGDGVGRIGVRGGEPEPLASFALNVKTVLNASGLRVHSADRPVHRVAVLGGSGGRDLNDAVAAGCDTYVTADIRHSVFLEAQSLGINLIDAGHYATEQVICPVLEAWIGAAFREVEIVQSKVRGDAALYL